MELKKIFAVIIGVVVLVGFVTGAQSQSESETTAPEKKSACPVTGQTGTGQTGACPMTGAGADTELKPQSVCPITGEEISKDSYVDVGGARIYVCCPECIDAVKADPAQAVRTMVENGEKPEHRLVVCSACGELKATANCCAADAEKCPDCGFNKGSVGCCRNLEAAEGQADVVLCLMCGGVKGSASCCAQDAPKCDGCGLIKGSPGCCKLSAVK